MFDFDNPGTKREGASDGKGGERMFYEELEENAQPQPLAAEDGAQYIEEDVPPFYDAMAEEYAAYEEEEAKQQAAASNFLDEFPEWKRMGKGSKNRMACGACLLLTAR